MTPRLHPAIDLSWPEPLDESSIDLVLAELDECSPAAVESHSNSIRVFFNNTDDRDRAFAIAAAVAPDAARDVMDVSDEAWAERSQASLAPVRVGRVVVSPPWRLREIALGDGEIEIAIQPSMGFGTAHHESTRLCLQLMQDLPLAGASALDIGTGSGVLAIAAAKLGAKSVLAIDIDPDALENARENVVGNQVQHLVETGCADVTRTPPARQFDLVTANLTGALIIRVADVLARAVAPSGSLIVSGLTGDEETGVVTALETAGLQSAQRTSEREWIGLRLVQHS